MIFVRTVCLNFIYKLIYLQKTNIRSLTPSSDARAYRASALCANDDDDDDGVRVDLARVARRRRLSTRARSRATSIDARSPSPRARARARVDVDVDVASRVVRPARDRPPATE